MQKLYLLAALLPATLEELILQFKREIAHRYRSVAALRPMDHIVLQDTFLLDEAQLPNLEQHLSGVFSSISPFTVELENFGAFPPHTIFAAIKQFFPFQNMRNRLNRILTREVGLSVTNSSGTVMTPHIPIAHRDLTPEAFEQAWTDFSSRELCYEFRLDSVRLLEQRGKWRIVSMFPLGKKIILRPRYLSSVCA